MKLKLIRSLWGVLDSQQSQSTWEPLFERLKNEGYQVYILHFIFYLMHIFQLIARLHHRITY